MHVAGIYLSCGLMQYSCIRYYDSTRNAKISFFCEVPVILFEVYEEKLLAVVSSRTAKKVVHARAPIADLANNRLPTLLGSCLIRCDFMFELIIQVRSLKRLASS